MRHLIPEDQLSLSRATGLRPLSPMIISLSGIASQPIKFQIAFQEQGAPTPGDIIIGSPTIWDIRALFETTGWYELVNYLYPEVSYLYNMSGPPIREVSLMTRFYMADPELPE